MNTYEVYVTNCFEYEYETEYETSLYGTYDNADQACEVAYEVGGFVKTIRN